MISQKLGYGPDETVMANTNLCHSLKMKQLMLHM